MNIIMILSVLNSVSIINDNSIGKNIVAIICTGLVYIFRNNSPRKYLLTRIGFHSTNL